MVTEVYRDVDNPEHEYNKYLRVNKNYEYEFDIKNKRVENNSIRGFLDYYDPYYKKMCVERKDDAVRLAQEKY